MNDTLSPQSLAELQASRAPPCLSLYQPTHRHSPDNQQDPIRFRNLVKALEASLLQRYPSADAHRLLEPFTALAQDHAFWDYTLDGLAVLGAPDVFRVYRLQRPVPELAVVADGFHTKPLRHFLQSVDRYHVLGLSRGRFQLFEGNRNALDEIEPAEGVARTLAEALGGELTERHHAVAAHGGADRGSNGAMHHGHASKKDEMDLDVERFFRAVDRAVLEYHSKPSGLPLILAALPEHHHLFRRVSRNPFLMDAGLGANPDGLTIDELRERIWDVAEPLHHARQVAWADAYSTAKAKGLGDDDLAQVAQAAADGRVATLLIESGRWIARDPDRARGQIEPADPYRPHADDLLDDLGQLVEKMGGEVRVLPTARMPGRTGLAATYRH